MLLVENFHRNAVDRKIIVEKFSSTRHFVDMALRRQAFRRKIFVDTAFHKGEKADPSGFQHPSESIKIKEN